MSNRFSFSLFHFFKFLNNVFRFYLNIFLCFYVCFFISCTRARGVVWCVQGWCPCITPRGRVWRSRYKRCFTRTPPSTYKPSTARPHCTWPVSTVTSTWSVRCSSEAVSEHTLGTSVHRPRLGQIIFGVQPPPPTSVCCSCLFVCCFLFLFLLFHFLKSCFVFFNRLLLSRVFGGLSGFLLSVISK